MATKLANAEFSDDVVISGIAGRFPESDNLMQLQENLFNKIDLITDDERRWTAGNPDIPQRTGKVDNLGKLDASFFGINSKEAHTMDPMARMLLEHTYEAIIDAGVNPRQLRGSNAGVFVGICYLATDSIWSYNQNTDPGLRTTGFSRSTIPNRISHWLGCTGPSYTLDSACSSSAFAIHDSYAAIRRGDCDSALVAGCNLCIHPVLSLQFLRLGALSREGYCRSFDADAKGYCRSEAVSVIYLQRAKDAKRIYARIVHSKTNSDGFKGEGITYPSGEMQRALLKQLYEECGVAPTSVAYVEAHGTGTRAGDPVETNAIAEVFCPGRTSPLRIGSVKSNLGHAEAASTMCSIAKIIIAMETGYIPPNLHYNRPHEGIPALTDGRLKVICEPTAWDGGYVGVSSFGFGGANAHVLLKSHDKEKISNGVPTDGIPRLVVVSGRTDEAVKTLLNDLESRPVDVEYVSLFHNIHAEEIQGHSYRGYTILPAQGLPKETIRDVRSCTDTKRPVCFLFSGMGSEWAGTGETLLSIPVFAKTAQKCHAILKPYGINVIDILTNTDQKIFDDILSSSVGVVVMQIGLVDTLACVQIKPDFTIGLSMGELGCAYANGCLTAEQVLLTTYYRSLVLAEARQIRGSMANVELNKTELARACPADIDIACHNSPENTTISGPTGSIEVFVAKLQKQGIRATVEPRSRIAFHSRYVEPVASRLLAHLREIIPRPKPRGRKWLSTSVPHDDWGTSAAQSCSPEYFANNLLKPVLFEETSRLVPNNAIVVEMSPHGSLQATLHQLFDKNVIGIALSERGSENNVECLLRAIGQLYQAGLHPRLTNLYPQVQYPVSRGTPMISPLLRWDHSEDWYVTRISKRQKLNSGERTVDINLSDDEFEWIAGHVIDGRILMPATGYLVLVWETLAMMHGEFYTEVSVVFENVTFHRATTIPKAGCVSLTITIRKGSGKFEIAEGSTTIVTGFVRIASNPVAEQLDITKSIIGDKKLELTTEDIYKEFRLRGYNYKGLFRGLKEASLDGTKGRIAWTNNWVAFMDNMLQTGMIGVDTRALRIPTSFRKVAIDAKFHASQLLTKPDENKVFEVEYREVLDMLVAGGIQIKGVKTTAIGRKKPVADPVIEDFRFVAHRDRSQAEQGVVIQIATHIAVENLMGTRIKAIELIGDIDISPDKLISPLIQKILGNIPLLQADVNVLASVDKYPNDAIPSDVRVSDTQKLAGESNVYLAVTRGLISSEDVRTLRLLKSAMSDQSFLLSLEPPDLDINDLSAMKGEGFDVVLEKRTENELVILLRRVEKKSGVATIVHVNNNEFTWLRTVQDALKEHAREKRCSKRIVLVSEDDFESGLQGLVNCLRREPGGEVIQGVLIQDIRAPKFSMENPLYSDQLKLGLALNVLRAGRLWGSYRFFRMNAPPMKRVHHARIDQYTHGDLSTLKWVEGMIQPNTRNENIIRIHYSSLNFRDLMMSTGKLAAEIAVNTKRTEQGIIGFEFSGKDANGRAVMGMINSCTFANLCVCESESLWAVPEHWTLEEAATIPAVYGTAYYALFIKGRMKKGEKVLIHSGSGGVGQAAITLALHTGCEVFTTVGTPEKREFIKTQFPQIDDDHIGNSRDTSFEQFIHRKTQGRGVDVVLNSLSEEKLQASVRCLATGGRFLEIGKFDLAANNPLRMVAFLKGISFHGVFLDRLLSIPSDVKSTLAAMLAEGIKTGAVRPLPRTVFAMEQVEAAFRYMTTGKHMGKVIVQIRNGDDEELHQGPLAIPRFYCTADRSYLVLGGLGGFGLELVDWLVLRGARKIVLTSRTGIRTGYQRSRVNLWKSYGAAIAIVVGKDASTHEGCEAILQEAVALAPVGAIFNLAVVLKDALFENQTEETFEESFRVKARATKRLDELSRVLCPDLKHFVVFSSVSCGRGNAGQTNYGMANSVMERICESRVAAGLPGLAIQWGAVGDVGLVAEMLENDHEVVIGGTLQQRISSCLQELDTFLQQKSTVVSSMVVAEKRASGSGAANIVEAVLNIMELKDLKTVSSYTPLAELGMDSMMAVEIKQTLEREFDVFITAADIRALNFEKLEQMSQQLTTATSNTTNEINHERDSLVAMRMLVRTLGMDEFSDDLCVPLVTESGTGRDEVFVIPGIEGNHIVFQTLAGRLKSPTTCLQFGTRHLNLPTIADMADHLVPHVAARSAGRENFVVAGYSFGCMVAIELARRLESRGLKGRLVLIDGSPDFVKAVTSLIFGDTDRDGQSSFLLEMVNFLEPSAHPKLEVELQKCHTWEDKIAVFAKHLPERVNEKFTPADKLAICSSIYSRIEAVRSYDSAALPPIESPVTLIKPKIQSLRSMSEDYGLRSVTRAKVNIHYADGDHATMLDDDICAAAIDGELDLKLDEGI